MLFTGLPCMLLGRRGRAKEVCIQLLALRLCDLFDAVSKLEWN